MAVENIFEYATRNKLRFPYKGNISVEYLWDLPVAELDTIFKALNAQVKLSQEESLLSKKSKKDEALSVQIDIVKHIVSVKIAEADARRCEAENAAKRQKIMQIIEEKKDEKLQNSSIEELNKMLDELS